MRLPKPKCSSGIRKTAQTAFGGLNHTSGAGDGEIWDMQNMTSDHCPLLASRSPRAIYRELTKPSGLFNWNGLCWADNGVFYYKGEEKGQVAAGDKAFAAIGPWIVILPDKRCYNVDTGEFKSMDAQWRGSKLIFEDGVLYGEAAEANAIRCEGVSWGDYFKAGDAVTISGCVENPGNNTSIIIRAIDGDKLYFYEHSFTLGEDGNTYEETGDLRIERTVPDLKFLCENKNRLWGCGDNTIYASKPGDPFNWNVFDGLDTDSWTVDTGSEGKFTGCVSFGGYPIFFKEDHIYKVYGSVPSNFDVLGSATMGLAAGSERSLAVAGEVLFYLGRNGVTAYTGGIPQNIGAAFGLQRFRNGVAGSDGVKYYISMEDENGLHPLYVYDTRTGQWHQEDHQHVTHFAACSGRLYMLMKSGEILITKAVAEDENQEEEVPWSVTFADFTDGSANKKGVGKIQIRLELDPGAFAGIHVMYDSDGVWHNVGNALCEGAKSSYYLPARLRRCDHYRLKIIGVGGCRIHSLAREYYTGSAR